MRLEIHNSKTPTPEILAIPKYRLAEGTLKRRLGVIPRFGKPGSFISGDRQWDGRRTTLNADVHADNDIDFIEQYKKIVEILDNRFNPYFIVDTENNRRLEFELDTLNPGNQQGTEKRLNKNTRLNILLPEVAWEDLEETEVDSPTGGMASGDTLIVTNSGQLELYPVITISPTSTNELFTIFNNTINDLIRIGSMAFTLNTTIEIDAINGTVFLDNGTTKTEISIAVDDGTGFFVLQRGENIIQYNSAFGAVDITVKFRNRYLF